MLLFGGDDRCQYPCLSNERALVWRSVPTLDFEANPDSSGNSLFKVCRYPFGAETLQQSIKLAGSSSIQERVRSVVTV